MAHKDLIDGTAYDTKGGNCLVDGTGYSIKKGRTLVDGTGYDVVFSQPCTVTITGTGNSTYCYVIIGGKTYTGAATVEVESGTVMKCYTNYQNTASMYSGVYLNGTRVGSPSSTYSYTIERDIDVEFSYSITQSSPPAPGAEKIISKVYITE